MPRLLLATNNRHKIAELRPLLSDLGIEVVSPAEIGVSLDVEENGATYADNAALKARAFARASGFVTLADDSGLEVDALGGQPGVYSSRYAGPGSDDAQRCALLLARLRDIPAERRAARFVCVIAIADPSGEVRLVEGECRGEIATEPRGSRGFGYDPVFFLPERGRTMAELPASTKNRISHRARAARRARAMLGQMLRRGEL